MSKRNEMYYKFYASDIFNTDQNFAHNTIANPRTKPISKKNHPTLESTKEEVFNIGKERRIRRNKEKKDNENNAILSRSVERRKKNYEHIYGSDIFNNRRATSTERRRGVKQIPNVTNKTTLLNQIGNNEEYIKDLKYYTSQHRAEKKEYDPDVYMSKITPQERFYREQYANHGVLAPNENISEEKKVNDYIHNKLNLKKEINKYNNVGADKKGKEGEVNYKEKRYFKQKPVGLYEGRRNFVDSKQYPQNNCKINKQIQMESHIFSNENKKKDFNEEVKEINDRLESEKNKHYHIDVLGQPIKKIRKERDSLNTDRSLYGSVNSRWAKTNLDWRSPEAQIMFCNTSTEDGRCMTARDRKINQLSGSQNVDILSGKEKEHNDIYQLKKDMQANDSGRKKFDEIIEEMPNLKEGDKYSIKMKASDLDCNNDEEWNNKGKLLNDFYRNKPSKIKREKEITGKVNDKHDRISNDLNNYNTNDNTFHDYVITYATKGNNQFEKFDEIDIQKLLGAKGILAYDIHKNPFDKGNYNTINIKLKGNDTNNELYNKVKKVQDDLRKQNYKINIEKGVVKNHGKKGGKMMLKPGSKMVVVNDNKNNEGGKYKMMPKEVKARKGFTKEFGLINYGYKKPLNI